ncbi:MAG: hypothetical protein HY855_25080 [Burkholderiales bacterium]|nr:hypothetical protein [Burkholderiales bacterium]
MSIEWTTRQLHSPLQRLVDQPAPSRNPRPAGVIRPGSAADAVLELLRRNPDRLFWRHQIIHATGRTRKAVDWALIFLEALKLIVAVDTGHSPRVGTKQFKLARGKRGRPGLPAGQRRVQVRMRIREELHDKLMWLGPEWLDAAVERAPVLGAAPGQEFPHAEIQRG